MNAKGFVDYLMEIREIVNLLELWNILIRDCVIELLLQLLDYFQCALNLVGKCATGVTSYIAFCD